MVGEEREEEEEEEGEESGDIGGEVREIVRGRGANGLVEFDFSPVIALVRGEVDDNFLNRLEGGVARIEGERMAAGGSILSSGKSETPILLMALGLRIGPEERGEKLMRGEEESSLVATVNSFLTDSSAMEVTGGIAAVAVGAVVAAAAAGAAVAFSIGGSFACLAFANSA